MPKVVRDKAQSVEEYRAKRRFKQGGQKLSIKSAT
jgi:hypothetical protein